MKLTPGTRLGPYEIVAALGAGGMGEVYRAKDTRLGREVALKLLPDATHRHRFEQEARVVAALNHPNIVAVFDVGDDYFVSELVDGESLRTAAQMPVRKVIEVAAQTADGLSAAHAAGVIHRDLKPENIMITRDGRAKVLDFGLAKIELQEDDPDATVAISKTTPGAVMGTAGYMSPEQVRGRSADHRSDIFSFGLVLYEMLAGKRAFACDSAVETMTAILTTDTPELPSSVPPAVAQIVEHCTEKNPANRFQSARDLAFALRALTGSALASGQTAAIASASAPSSKELPAVKLPTPWRTVALASLALTVCSIGAVLWLWLGHRPAPLPRFTRMTFQRGFVTNARFVSGGQTIAYSAAFEGQPLEIYSTRVESRDSRPLALRNAHVFSVSSNGDLAVGLDVQFNPEHGLHGALARIPLGGGAPRQLMKDVYAAEWEPKGSRLAVARMEKGVFQIEFPPGKVLYKTAGWIADLRFSPDGKHLAFSDHPLRWDDRGDVVMVDLDGQKTIVSKGWESIEGLAWNSAGDEIFFAGAEHGVANSITAVTLSGKRRDILQTPNGLVLQDIAPDGRILLSGDEGTRIEITSAAVNDTHERSLGYLDQSAPVDISADGKTLLFVEYDTSSNYAVCIRKLDGSPTVVLGDGQAMALSNDGNWALAALHTMPPQLIAIPIGPGETVHLPQTGLNYQTGGQWFADSRRILFAASEPGKGTRLWTQNVFPQDAPLAFTGEGMSLRGHALSPDGTMVVATAADHITSIYPINGDPPLPIAGLQPEDEFVRWSPDGKFLYVATAQCCPSHVFQIDWRSGARKHWKDIVPADRTGVFRMNAVLLTPDASTVVYGTLRYLVNLQLVNMNPK